MSLRRRVMGTSAENVNEFQYLYGTVITEKVTIPENQDTTTLSSFNYIKGLLKTTPTVVLGFFRVNDESPDPQYRAIGYQMQDNGGGGVFHSSVNRYQNGSFVVTNGNNSSYDGKLYAGDVYYVIYYTFDNTWRYDA